MCAPRESGAHRPTSCRPSAGYGQGRRVPFDAVDPGSIQLSAQLKHSRMFDNVVVWPLEELRTACCAIRNYSPPLSRRKRASVVALCAWRIVPLKRAGVYVYAIDHRVNFVYQTELLRLSRAIIATVPRNRRRVPIRGLTTSDEDDDMISSLIMMITPFSCAQSALKETVASR